MRAFIVAAVILGLTSATLNAQGTRYSTWSDPSAPGSGSETAAMQDFIQRLNKLIDDAEKAKAADPVFLKDLRALAAGTTTPWNVTLLDDSFADGNFTANPVWQVLSGEYFIETGWGLRNKLVQAQPAQTGSSGGGGDDFAKVLLGQILKRATNTPTGTAATSENSIVTRAKISNAFALEMDMSSWISENHFEVGVFQGDQAQIGYRLLYVSDKGLQLHRVGSSGSSVIATSEPITLEDKKYHLIKWTRSADGAMQIGIDGKEVISTSDRAFSDPFDGVRIADKGGDFIIRRITVKGL